MRESFFSAVRSVIEGMARRNPLVLVFEDIHWADHGMLDLIEYLAQWVRGPLVLLCLARDELLERRARLGRRPPRGDLDPARPADHRPDPRAGGGAARRRRRATAGAVAAVAERAGGNPFFAEEMARRLADESGGGLLELPETVQACWPPGSTRSSRSSAASSSTPRWWGARSGRARSTIGGLTEIGAHVRRCQSLQEKDIIVPETGVRLAGEREYAFKHVLIRDVAYGMLPKAVRWRKHYEVGQFIEERAGERTDEVVALLAEHYGRAALLGAEAGLDTTRSSPSTARRCSSSRPPATRPPRCTPTPRPSTTTRRRAGSSARTTPTRSRG